MMNKYVINAMRMIMYMVDVQCTLTATCDHIAFKFAISK